MTEIPGWVGLVDPDAEPDLDDHPAVTSSVGDARQPEHLDPLEVPFAERPARLLAAGEVSAAGWHDAEHTWTGWECDCKTQAGHYATAGRVVIAGKVAQTVGAEALPVACVGGPLDGQWFTLADWDVGLRAAIRSGNSSRTNYQARGFVEDDETGRPIATTLRHRPGRGDPRRRDRFPLVLHAGPGLQPPPVESVPCPTWRPATWTNRAEPLEQAEPLEAVVSALPAGVLEAAVEVTRAVILPASARPLLAHAGRCLRSVARLVDGGPVEVWVGMAGLVTRDGERVLWWARWRGPKFEVGFWAGSPVGVRVLRARLEGKPDPVAAPRAPRKAAAGPRRGPRRNEYIA